LSGPQEEFLLGLSQRGYWAEVAYGYNEAVEKINSYLWVKK